MGYKFNPITGNFDLTNDDPLTLSGLTVNGLATISHIHGDIAGSLYVHVKNTSNVTIAKGAPVYVTGAVGDTTTLEIAAADSANPAKMPAIGLLSTELAHNAFGHCVMFGELTNVNTGSYALGDELYVAAGGGLTKTKPTSGEVQNVAVVGRIHATAGTLLVWTAGVTDATPGGGGGGSSTKTLATFTARENLPPATNFATLDTRNAIPVTEYDATTEESGAYIGVIPEGANLSSGLLVRLWWMGDTATSGNVRWGVQFEKSGTDVDVDSFDSLTEVTSAASATSGIETVAEITCTAIDSLAAGDRFRLRVVRRAADAADTMTGDAQLVAVEIRQVA